MMMAIVTQIVTDCGADSLKRMPQRIRRESFTGTTSDPTDALFWLVLWFLLRRFMTGASSSRRVVSGCLPVAGSACWPRC